MAFMVIFYHTFRSGKYRYARKPHYRWKLNRLIHAKCFYPIFIYMDILFLNFQYL